MVIRNDPERPTGAPVRGDGEKRGEVDAAPHATGRSAERNAELDTVEHDLRDFRR